MEFSAVPNEQFLLFFMRIQIKPEYVHTIFYIQSGNVDSSRIYIMQNGEKEEKEEK